MLIFGHSHITMPHFRRVENIQSIQTSPNDSIVWFRHNENFALLKHCKEFEIPCAVMVENMIDFMLCAHFSPRFLLVDSHAQEYQKIIDTYLLDSKLLCVVEDLSEIKSLAPYGIDGVITKAYLGL